MAGKEQAGAGGRGSGSGPPPRVPVPAVSTQPPIKKLVRQLDFTSAGLGGNPAMAAAAAAVNRALQPRPLPLYPQPHQLRPALPMGVPHQLQPRALPVMRPHQMVHVPLPRSALQMAMPVPLPQARPALPQPVQRPPVAVPL